MPPVAPQPVQIQCPACGTPFRAAIYTLLDVSDEPELKFSLLSGQVNVAVCQNCGTPTRLAAPLLYHDASKQLCFAYFPQEQQAQARPEDQERFIGEATSFIIRNLPPNAPRAYLLAPRRFLTLQALLEGILEAEGPGRAALERQLNQRLHMSLIQVLASLLANDEQQFEAMLQYQREAITPELLLDLQSLLTELPPELEESRPLLDELLSRLQNLGDEAAEPIDAAELEEAVQRLVNASDVELPRVVAELRPYIEYELFERLDALIAAEPERAAELTARRDAIAELSAELDRQIEAAFEVGNALLNEVIDTPNPVVALWDRADRVSEDLLTVLSLHRGAAQSVGQQELDAVLEQLELAAAQIIEARLTPEQRFINELLAAETPQDATKILRKSVAKINPELVKLLNAQAEHEEQRANKPAAERLRQMAREAGAMLF
ncbi:MAG: CpXC domain-containing protein [Oscillochloridaceae bacterium umkhey_bin13]